MVMTKTCPYCAEEIKPEAIKCKHCGTWLSPPAEAFAYNGSATGRVGPSFDKGGPRRLVRTTGDAMWAGVCGGVARFLGIDATLVRVAVAVTTLVTMFLPGLLIYWALAIIVPPDHPEAD